MRKDLGKDLDNMTVRELRARAKELGVNVKASAKKNEIIEALRGAQTSKTQPAEAKTTPAKATTTRTATATPSTKATTRKRTTAQETVQPVEERAIAAQASTTPAVTDTLSAQERVEESKFHLGAAPAPARTEESFVLPSTYGEDRVTLLVRDPHWLYAYWDFSAATRQQLDRMDGGKAVLRVKDVTEADPDVPRGFSDVELPPGADNWYVHVDAPECNYCVDIGILTPAGDFVVLARSNTVRPPRSRPSDVLAEEWRGISLETYEQMYQLSAGGAGGVLTLLARSSPELLERVTALPAAEYMASPGLFSGALFSRGAEAARAREFFLEVWTELIVYGRTQPDAKVTLQGRPIRLRYDGTFTARFALPDGEQVLPVRATSSDDEEERTVTPVVAKRTE
jgi:hypothetical protein